MRISDWSSDVCSSDLVASDPGSQLDAIVVTATKRAGGVNVQDVATAITALGTEQMERMHLRDISEVGFKAPNVILEGRSEEHTSELQSLMRISYAVFCLKKKKIHNT